MTVYTIDWSNTNVDGINGPDGAIGVSVATPQNAEGKQWFVDGPSGMLKNCGVQSNSSADITFSGEVSDVKFTLLSVDSMDKITIMTKDANGAPVEVQFENTGTHPITGNTIVGNQTIGTGHTIGTVQDIDICIPGPVKTFWVVCDGGPARHYATTVAVGDVTFNAIEDQDGTVEGTNGSDIIDVAYADDPDGDMVDNNDAILPGDSGDGGNGEELLTNGSFGGGRHAANSVNGLVGWTTVSGSQPLRMTVPTLHPGTLLWMPTTAPATSQCGRPTQARRKP